MRSTLLLALALVPFGLSAPQPDPLREAVLVGRSQDDALVVSFNKSYQLSPSGMVERAEIVTEFRRAAMMVREHALRGDHAFGIGDLPSELAPWKGLTTFVVQVRLNNLVRVPAHDLYISTGPHSPPIGTKTLKRDPIYPPGAPPGSAVVGVRLEGSFPRAEILLAAAPMVTLVNEKADIVWQAWIDLSRYR